MILIIYSDRADSPLQNKKNCILDELGLKNNSILIISTQKKLFSFFYMMYIN